MLGIDVSKHHLVCALFDPHTRQLLWEMTVPNTPAGWEQLAARVPADHPWVLEPTGRYSQGVALFARTAGRTVLLAQPQQARAFLQSLNPRAKTDRLDARGLALFGLSRTLPPYPVKSEAVAQLDQLLTARKALSAAQAGLQQRRKELAHAAPYLEPACEELIRQLEALDAQLATLVAASEVSKVVAALDAVPGIGPVTAVSVVSRLLAKEFQRSDQFVAYLGLDVRVRTSGRRTQETSRFRLSKHGDAELRRLLFLCAKASLRCRHSPFRAQYERELAKGLSKTAALCAMARKLARLCWSMHRHGTKFDPERVYRPPVPAELISAQEPA